MNWWWGIYGSIYPGNSVHGNFVKQPLAQLKSIPSWVSTETKQYLYTHRWEQYEIVWYKTNNAWTYLFLYLTMWQPEKALKIKNHLQIEVESLHLFLEMEGGRGLNLSQ